MVAKPSWFKGILIETDWQLAPEDGGKRARFFNRTQRDLIKISQLPTGADLLNLIARRYEGVGTKGSGKDRSVTIRIGKEGEAGQGPSTNAWYMDRKYHVDKMIGTRTMKFAGEGSKTIIYIQNDDDSEEIYTRLAGVRTPTYIALGHELIHALHHLSGTTYSEVIDGSDGEIRREEMFTTGLGPYAKTRISENALRAEAHLPRRTHYYFPGDEAEVKALAPTLHRKYVKFWMCSCLRELMVA
ncbi:MAG TPA: M91 family zinc metallopeptidase [Acetobacteraceae bacterium]|nr:M91 family zinc metallopeptidase [Acetobacteraceae bacterium]